MNLIDKIKMLFEATNFLDVKAADGTLLRTPTAFEVGEAVEVIAEDGTTAPAPDNSYTLEDGSILNIVGGLITEVTPADAEGTDLAATPEAPAADPIAETPVDEANEDNAMADLTDRVSQLEAALAMLIEKLSTNQTDVAASKVALSKLAEENKMLKAEPAAKPATTKKFEKVENKTSTSTNRIQDLLVNNIKK